MPVAEARLTLPLMLLLLPLASCLTPPAAQGSRQARMPSGAFIQLDASLSSFTREEWRTELRAMRDIGMDTVVVQYSAYAGSVFYPVKQSPPSEAPDTIGEILGAAEELSMSVFLGLSSDPAFFENALDPGREADMNVGILDDLYRLYRGHGSLAGWYLPEELDDQRFQSAAATAAVKEYLAHMSGYAHETTGLPVMIAPYFGMNPWPSAYARWWDTILSDARVDIIALQDGVGTHRTSVTQSARVFAALAPVFARHGVRFWADVEVFDQTHGWPVDDGAWSAVTASIERLRAQIGEETPWVEKCIVFDFPHYMSPRVPQRLYQEYLQMIQGDAP